jgi:hypothetical protein
MTTNRYGERLSPLGAVARGAIAGVAGTTAMTAWQTAAQALFYSSDSSSEPPSDPWEQAPAPAKVARRVIKGVFKRDVSPNQIPLLTNVMHWSYGMSWGCGYGLVAGTARKAGLKPGLLFGLTVWGSSYAELVPMGLYELPWKYPPKEVALDISYHLVYGAGVGVASGLLLRV